MVNKKTRKSISKKSSKSKTRKNNYRSKIKEMEKIFKLYPDVFPSGYFRFFNASMSNKIKNNEYIFKNGVIMTWKIYKRKSQIHTDKFPIEVGDVKINQLVNKNPGNGKAKKIFTSFLKKHNKKKIYLDVRSDNKRAVKFYKKNKFRKIGEVIVGKDKLKMTIMRRNPQ